MQNSYSSQHSPPRRGLQYTIDEIFVKKISGSQCVRRCDISGCQPYKAWFGWAAQCFVGHSGSYESLISDDGTLHDQTRRMELTIQGKMQPIHQKYFDPFIA